MAIVCYTIDVPRGAIPHHLDRQATGRKESTMTHPISSSALDQLVEAFPLGSTVRNFGSIATVIGYHYSEPLSEYTGNLIVSDSTCKWVADPDKCVKI